jgi:hypothetical protein
VTWEPAWETGVPSREGANLMAAVSSSYLQPQGPAQLWAERHVLHTLPANQLSASDSDLQWDIGFYLTCHLVSMVV